MATTDRRRRHRASLRREILDAASQLFVEEGYHGLTMRRLAERIEYSPTTIYLYFKDKNELLTAVCDETFAKLAGKLEQLQKDATSPLGCLRDGLRTYVEFGLAHPNQYIVTFMSPRPGLEAEGSHQRTIGDRAFGTFRAAVSACEASGDLRLADIDTTAQALWAAAHGLTSLLITQRGFPFAAQPVLVDHLIDSLIGGLRTPSVTPPRTPVPQKSKKWEFFD
jgi:AcrR family transcriptional regulator